MVEPTRGACSVQRGVETTGIWMNKRVEKSGDCIVGGGIDGWGCQL